MSPTAWIVVVLGCLLGLAALGFAIYSLFALVIEEATRIAHRETKRLDDRKDAAKQARS